MGELVASVLEIERRPSGVVDAMPTRPFEVIESAVFDDVAKVDGDAVATKRLPLIDRNVHGLLVPLVSESAS